MRPLARNCSRDWKTCACRTDDLVVGSDGGVGGDGTLSGVSSWMASEYAIEITGSCSAEDGCVDVDCSPS